MATLRDTIRSAMGLNDEKPQDKLSVNESIKKAIDIVTPPKPTEQSSLEANIEAIKILPMSDRDKEAAIAGLQNSLAWGEGGYEKWITDTKAGQDYARNFK